MYLYDMTQHVARNLRALVMALITITGFVLLPVVLAADLGTGVATDFRRS